MKKYIVIYHAPAEAMPQTGDVSPEEAMKGMEAWMVWAEKCGEKLIDMGTPLADGLRLLTGGGSENSAMQVVGYSILEAENMQDAHDLLTGHPHLGWNNACAIEVHEAQPLPGQ